MIDPKKVNFNEVPKVFCDGALGAFSKQFFTFSITSGNRLHSFATTPQIMKSIALWANDTVKKYEEQHGTIDMTPTPIQSPIKASDLKDFGDSASEK